MIIQNLTNEETSIMLAQEIMGWEYVEESEKWDPLNNTNDAFRLLDKLKEKGFSIVLSVNKEGYFLTEATYKKNNESDFVNLEINLESSKGLADLVCRFGLEILDKGYNAL